MKMHKISKYRPILGLGWALLSLVACQEKTTYRSYQEIEIEPKTQAPMGTNSQIPLNPNPTRAGSKLAWNTPEGWTEEKGNGMRLSTFFFNNNNKTAECTIVMLSGDAGGLESNVKRWLGQLNLVIPSDEKLAAFLSRQTEFSTEEGHKGVMVDFSQLLSGSLIESKTSYSSMINIGESTVFVKLVGDKSLLMENRDKFMALCKSLRLAP